MSQNIPIISLTKSGNNKLPSPATPDIPTLLRLDSTYYSTERKRRAKSNKHDTLLKWNLEPTNVLIIKKINDTVCTNDALDVAFYLLSEKKTTVYFEEQTHNEFQQMCTANSNNNNAKKQESIKQKASKVMCEQYREKVKYQNDQSIGRNIHLIIVLGGDGTLLYLVSLFGDHRHVPPIVCFQRGSLGFLAPFQMQNYKEILTKLLDQNQSAEITIRMRLTARIWRHPKNIEKGCTDAHLQLSSLGQGHRSWSQEILDINAESNAMQPISSISEEESKDTFEIEKNTDILFMKTQNIFPTHTCNEIICHALNEVLIHRNNNASMMTGNLYIDGDKCTTIEADGMIVSTPTGSTAYNISAGGPLISPNVQCIALTPICPHTLSFRPVIVSDETIIHIEIPTYARFNAIISFDGRNHITLEKGDVVEIVKCPYHVPTFKGLRLNVEWFQALVSKFNWNLREMQKPFEMSENNENITAKSDDSKAKEHT